MWKIKVTDPIGKPIKKMCKSFEDKTKALAYANSVYRDAGNGKTRSIYIDKD